jgi:hypothetical protein
MLAREEELFVAEEEARRLHVIVDGTSSARAPRRSAGRAGR